MKHALIIASSFLFLACNNAENKIDNPGKSENDIDAARNFIRAALDGRFDDAKAFLLIDSPNIQYFDVYERNYRKINPDVKRNYHEATITVYNVDQLNDSTTVVIYANSFKNDRDTLRVLKKREQWLVDLKYLFEHDEDTTRKMQELRNKIK